MRAERSGKGDGRVYLVNFVASDGMAESEGSVVVIVPHDKSSQCEAGDSGQDYDTTELN